MLFWKEFVVLADILIYSGRNWTTFSGLILNLRWRSPSVTRSPWAKTEQLNSSLFFFCDCWVLFHTVRRGGCWSDETVKKVRKFRVLKFATALQVGWAKILPVFLQDLPCPELQSSDVCRFWIFSFSTWIGGNVSVVFFGKMALEHILLQRFLWFYKQARIGRNLCHITQLSWHW